MDSHVHQGRGPLETPWPVVRERQDDTHPKGFEHRRWPKFVSHRNLDCEVADFVEEATPARNEQTRHDHDVEQVRALVP